MFSVVSGLRFTPPQRNSRNLRALSFQQSFNDTKATTKFKALCFQKSRSFQLGSNNIKTSSSFHKSHQALSFQSSANFQARAFSTKLTHVDDSGKAMMVNVIDKSETKRIAVASCHVKVSAEISKLISSNLMKKGDVLTIAQISGIMAAKTTSNLIPLTHNIPLSSVKVDVKLNEELHQVEILATVECFGKTGVEIEALTAVSIAALTVYDMCKAVSHDITINDIQLVEKRGGKSHFKRI